MAPGMEKILGQIEKGRGVEGGRIIANLLGDLSGMYGVLFR